MAGILAKVGVWLLVAMVLVIKSYVESLARHPALARRLYPMTSAFGLFFAWLVVGIVVALVVMLTAAEVLPGPEVMGDPQARDPWSDLGLITVGAAVVLSFTFAGPVISLPIIGRWRRFSDWSKRAQLASFLGIGERIRGPLTRGGRIDIAAANLSMEFPKDWLAFDLTRPDLITAAAALGEDIEAAAQRALDRCVPQVSHLLHARQAGTTAPVSCDMISCPDLAEAAVGDYRSRTEATKEIVARLRDWREPLTTPSVSASNLGLGHGVTVDFECKPERPWGDRVRGFLIPLAGGLVYIEFRSHRPLGRDTASNRWRVLVDTLAVSKGPAADDASRVADRAGPAAGVR